MDIKRLLDEYRDGDEGVRLRLFLAFRDLRNYFSRIDQESPAFDVTLFKLPWRRAKGRVGLSSGSGKAAHFHSS